MRNLKWRLGWLYRTWKLSRYRKMGHIRYFDWFPLFCLSWDSLAKKLTLHTQGDVTEDCEPCYNRRRHVSLW